MRSTARAHDRPAAAPERLAATLAPETAAWIAAGAAALVVPLAILVLGPPLGTLLFPRHPVRFWPDIAPGFVRPEPTEHARYLLALSAPLLLVALTVALVRRPPLLAAHTGPRLARMLEGLALLALVAFLVVQHTYDFASGLAAQAHVVYFRTTTLLLAVALGAAMYAGLRSARVRAAAVALARETRARAGLALLVALALIVVTLLPGITTDRSVLLGNRDVAFHLPFIYDEVLAVVNGRTPLGDFAAQYGSLWLYVAAATMAVLGTSLTALTVTMVTISGTAMLALYAVLRRVTRSSLAALALFAPLLATSIWWMHGTRVSRFSMADYFGTMPMRYAGPFLLLWLLVRHLDGARPRRAWPLLLAGGLAVAANSDFGFAALAATAVVLAERAVRAEPGARSRLALEAAAGLAAAVALVCALVLARTGALPHPSLIARYTRIYAVGGFSMEPMRPVVGLSTIIFLTYLAALAVATVRVLARAPDRLLTSLLVWSGVFGLGAGGYYMGRSVPEVLEHEFAAWALCLVLLTVLVVRALAARGGRRPRALELACLVGFALLACSLGQTPAPWSQLARIERRGPEYLTNPPGQAFVAAHVRRGEHVALLMMLGHRVAENLGVQDVDPYSGIDSLVTEEQLDDVVAQLRAAGGHRIVLSDAENGPTVPEALRRHGFVRVAQNAQQYQLWLRR